jgi:hypothetical protein
VISKEEEKDIRAPVTNYTHTNPYLTQNEEEEKVKDHAEDFAGFRPCTKWITTYK